VIIGGVSISGLKTANDFASAFKATSSIDVIIISGNSSKKSVASSSNSKIESSRVPI